MLNKTKQQFCVEKAVSHKFEFFDITFRICICLLLVKKNSYFVKNWTEICLSVNFGTIFKVHLNNVLFKKYWTSRPLIIKISVLKLFKWNLHFIWYSCYVILHDLTSNYSVHKYIHSIFLIISMVKRTLPFNVVCTHCTCM